MIKLGLLLIVAALLVFYGWSVMSKYDEPAYQVLESDGDVEIRAYQPFIIAEVSLTGEREEAISAGFRLLADYIFGNNQAQATETASKEKIPMTAPVLQQSSKKIAMTVPVMQNANDNHWLVRFVMPKHYTLKTLPKPNNPQVTLREVRGENRVVVRFSGGSSKTNLERHLNQLNDYVATHQLIVSGEPTYAFYNPPWTLPFLRRNEIMYTVVKNK